MNPEHPEFADWDVAYMLGALSPADRRLFEAHLQDCDLCRASILESAPTIALLSRVTPDRAQSLLDTPDVEDGPDAARRTDVVARGVRESRRRRRVWWIASTAAAAVIVVAAVLIGSFAMLSQPRNGRLITLDAITDVPLTATVELVDVAWGTRLEMTCKYGAEPESGGPEEGWPYALVLTSVDGTVSEVSSWRALPETTARIGAGTALNADQIASVEIRSLATGRVLMRTELHPASSTGG